MHATTYEEWRTEALASDRRRGIDEWRERDRSRRYDFKVVRERYEELLEVRASGDSERLLYFLNEGLHGNMGGMGSSDLYTKAQVGTKSLVTNYINEVALGLEQLEEVGNKSLSMGEKLEFFRRASACHGRTALMLSGAGSLGPFHIGVVKALVEQGILPRVISGASAGSLVAAIAGTHPEAELVEVLEQNSLEQFQHSEGGPPMKRQVKIHDLHEMVEALVPDLTFAEARDLTGRDINISVAPSGLHQQPRLLNAASSPDVFIRESVYASCAIPGVFPAVTLAAKNAKGKRHPYVPSRQWVDGSVTNDQPAKQLSRLYGANHFIASQANPIVLWALSDPLKRNGLLSDLFSIYQASTREWLKAMYPFAMNMVRGINPLNTMTRMCFGVMTQEYTADINLIPEKRFFDPRMLLAKLTAEETEVLITMGERATWPRVEMIRNCTRISRTIDGIVDRLEAQIEPA